MLLATIADRAKRLGGQVFIQQIGGPSLTYGEFHESCLRWAGVLDRFGIVRGEPVLSTLTGVAAYRTWLGAGWAGAVHVPVNPDLRGQLLESAIRTTGARLAVVERRHLEHFKVVADRIPLDQVLVIDADNLSTPTPTPPELVAVRAVRARTHVQPRSEPEPRSVAVGIFTSGTTGQSKCALRSWAGVEKSGQWLFPGDTSGSTPGGAYYSPWPLFHSLGLTAIAVAVQRDLRLVLREGFSLSRWWEDIRAYGCTHAVALVVAPLLLGREPDPADRDNPLHHLTVVPLVRHICRLEARFGVQVSTMYGQTETGPVLATSRPVDHRTSGRPIPSVEVAIVGDDGDFCNPGDVGELIVRPGSPGQIAEHYLGMAEAMEKKWHDGWFHTGDAFRVDGLGNYQFVDRLSDSIRSRGHNVSSVELEGEIIAHHAVAECACIGVPSELAEADTFGDEDVKAVIVLCTGANLSAAALIDFLTARLPRYMLPRYVEFVAELPKTPTMKVRKELLRQSRPDAVVWDRQLFRH